MDLFKNFEMKIESSRVALDLLTIQDREMFHFLC